MVKQNHLGLIKVYCSLVVLLCTSWALIRKLKTHLQEHITDIHNLMYLRLNNVIFWPPWGIWQYACSCWKIRIWCWVLLQLVWWAKYVSLRQSQLLSSTELWCVLCAVPIVLVLTEVFWSWMFEGGNMSSISDVKSIFCQPFIYFILAGNSSDNFGPMKKSLRMTSTWLLAVAACFGFLGLVFSWKYVDT